MPVAEKKQESAPPIGSKLQVDLAAAFAGACAFALDPAHASILSHSYDSEHGDYSIRLARDNARLGNVTINMRERQIRDVGYANLPFDPTEEIWLYPNEIVQYRSGPERREQLEVIKIENDENSDSIWVSVLIPVKQ